MLVTNGGQTSTAQVPSVALEFAKGQDEETRTRKSKRPLREYIGMSSINKDAWGNFSKMTDTEHLSKRNSNLMLKQK